MNKGFLLNNKSCNIEDSIYQRQNNIIIIKIW